MSKFTYGTYAPLPCDVWELQYKWMTPQVAEVENCEEVVEFLRNGNRYYFALNGEIWIVCVNRIDLGYLHIFRARHCHLRRIYNELFTKSKYEALPSQIDQIFNTVKRTWQTEET